MKILIQRVSEAGVTVDGRGIGRVGRGLLLLFCAEAGDGEDEARAMAGKVARLRIFPDEAGKMNRSLLDVGGGALVVSQFTLCADTRRGNRPGFSGAAPPDEAEALCACFGAALSTLGIPVETGAFGAHMAVSLVNDGPVTIWLDSRAA